MKESMLMTFALVVLTIGAYRGGYFVPERSLALQAATEGGAEDDSKEIVVTIRDLAFGPKTVRVKRGQVVTWTNRDDFVHTATADDDSFDTDVILPGESVSVRFTKPGAFSYFCTPHPFMKAMVIVGE